MARLISKRQAWLHLAKAWASARPNILGAYSVCFYDEKIGAYGLCESIDELRYVDELISETVAKSMLGKLKGHGYRWPLTAAGKRSRIAFCRRQAKLLEKKTKPAKKE